MQRAKNIPERHFLIGTTKRHINLNASCICWTDCQIKYKIPRNSMLAEKQQGSVTNSREKYKFAI